MKKFTFLLFLFILTIPILTFAQEEQENEEEEENIRIEIHKSIEEKLKNRHHKESEDDDTDRTKHYFNIDLGINNLHNNLEFPDETNQLYGVRPWGSWYVGLTSLQRTHMKGGAFLEWGAGVSWYNFKFQEDNLLINETPDGIDFSLDARPDVVYDKSKLTVIHANLYLVPVYQFGDDKEKHRQKKWTEFDNYDSRGFRIGLGGYVGYRLGSYTKVKFEEEGDSEKVKNSDNFFLENLRYGLRFQMGYKGSDIFINYDLNDLFSEGNGPEVSPISIGLMF